MFLEVKFHDNDFGRAMTSSLERLWKWVVSNNGHMTPRSKYLTISEIFLKLHEKEALEHIFKRMFVLESMLSNIEFETRGLYHKEDSYPFWKEGKKIDSDKMIETLKHYYGYMNIKIEFHNDKEFAKEWQNGEHAWLNIDTGEVETF